MAKTVTNRTAAPVLALESAVLDFDTLVREGLLAAGVAGAMRALSELMEAEVDQLVGPRNAKLGNRRVNYRHGTAAGSVVLGGRRVPVERPLVRSRDGGEVPLAVYDAAADDTLLTRVVLERTVASLPLRRQRRAGEPVGEYVSSVERSTSPSALSRRLKKGAESAIGEVVGRDLSEMDVTALMVDGVWFADHCCVVALAIDANGNKAPVGLALGDTENKRIVTDLLVDLVDRGLDTSRGLLVVIDGAKALRGAVTQVFGADVAVQRCQLHKRRNVCDNLPVKERQRVDRRLARAFADTDPDKGIRAARVLAAELEGRWPRAAASLREGLDEMFTTRRLGVTGSLARTLDCTNAVESMFSVARTVTRNVKRWRDPQMAARWACLGMLHAEAGFRRVQGWRDLPKLRAALQQHAATNRRARTLRA